MILGMNIAFFTQLHVVISLIAIVSGLAVAGGMIMGQPFPTLTAIFLLTTVLTSVTGLMFPAHGITPGIVVGVLSLIVLLFTLIARYGGRLVGAWRKTYVITAMFALYLNVFVLIAQLFEHVPVLHALAPTGTETAFKVSQLFVLVGFILLTKVAARKFWSIYA